MARKSSRAEPGRERGAVSGQQHGVPNSGSHLPPIPNNHGSRAPILASLLAFFEDLKIVVRVPPNVPAEGAIGGLLGPKAILGGRPGCLDVTRGKTQSETTAPFPH